MPSYLKQSELLEWVELLKLYGFGHWEAESFVNQHLDCCPPMERPEYDRIELSGGEFIDLGGSD